MHDLFYSFTLCNISVVKNRKLQLWVEFTNIISVLNIYLFFFILMVALVQWYSVISYHYFKLNQMTKSIGCWACEIKFPYIWLLSVFLQPRFNSLEPPLSPWVLLIQELCWRSLSFGSLFRIQTIKVRI